MRVGGGGVDIFFQFLRSNNVFKRPYDHVFFSQIYEFKLFL